MTVKEIITSQVIEMLSNGIVPWERPWVAGTCAPRGYEMKPGQSYTGVNRLLLPFQGEYLTRKMVEKYHGQVIDKARSYIVTFKAPAKANEQESDVETENVNGTFKRWVFRYYRVYHIDNIEGVESKVKTRTDEADSLRPVEKAENLIRNFVNSCGVKLSIVRCNNPRYDEATDTITMPLLEQFHNEESYYHTLFQWLVRATGHVDRLCRDVGQRQQDTPAEQRERIVDEMGASFLMSQAGLDVSKVERNSAAHIAELLEALKQDSGLVCWAAGKAEKAYNMIIQQQAAETAAAA